MLLIQPLHIIHTLILTTMYRIQVLRKSLLEFFSVYCCAFADTPLYLRDNKEWQKANRSNYTASASGNRYARTSTEGSGSILKEYLEHLITQKGNRNVSDIKERRAHSGNRRNYNRDQDSPNAGGPDQST